jgi:uncharacterized protein
MRCPVCAEPHLVIAERQGIEIDYCPQCRGVWLDRGELDKIIERSASLVEPRVTSAGATTQPLDYQQERPRPDRRDRDWDDDRRKKKRRNFLDELFDFD